MDSLVSVIIPAFNASDTLQDCLRAIRKSSYTNYEITVVDDGSTDATYSIAEQYADKVIRYHKTLGEGPSRNRGAKVARGDILVFIDSDVVVKDDTLEQIVRYFNEHASVAALTGRLSKDNPYANFFSQYKNLYMHYTFGLLSERVNFLYGSIHAIRKNEFLEYGTRKFAADTDLGIELAKRGKEIAFLKSLEVAHLKKHTLFSFILNDFSIVSAWSGLFFTKQGLKQFFRGKTVFAHAQYYQVISILISPLILLLFCFYLFGYRVFYAPLLLSAIFLFCNYKFIMFLVKERGYIFGLEALVVTYLDNIIMFVGIFHGLLQCLLRCALLRKRRYEI